MRFFLRVIAGIARRTPLVAPAGFFTRPTADRAKENLFNILGARVKSACVADFFCGSGAIGIEALSRGAKNAVFVDNEPLAIRALETNLAKTKLQNAQIFQIDAQQAIMRFSAQKQMFDLIFLDPPYNLPQTSQIISEMFSVLAKNGTIIAETQSDFTHNEEFLADVRVYGRTKFLFYAL